MHVDDLTFIACRLPTLHGWQVHCDERMGTLWFAHSRTEYTVCATPNWEGCDGIAVGVMDDAGRCTHSDEIPWCDDGSLHADRGPLAYAASVAPFLAKINAELGL